MMLLRLLGAFDREYWRATVITLQGGRVADEIAALGVDVHDLALDSPLALPGAVAALCRLARLLRPDLLQGWMYHGNWAAWVCYRALHRRVPLLWNIRQALYDLAQSKFATACLIRSLAAFSRSPAAIIYNAETSALHHQALGYAAASKVVIGNGFSGEEFRPSPEARWRLRRELGVSEHTPLIGLCARYHPIKDHATFLRAASLLRDMRPAPAPHFVLAGTGVDDANHDLTGLVQTLALTGSVHLLGERHDMPQVQAALDIATLSSYGEAFPNTIGEAMCCAVPCVTTAVGEAATLVGDTGIVVEPRQPIAIAAAWQRLLSMTPAALQALGADARARILTHYSLAAIAGRYAQLYKKILWGKRQKHG